MGHPVSLSTRTGRIGGWRADPPIPPKGALIVVQDIFGVDLALRQVVDRLAAHGFIALAPALFDHVDYHIELPVDEAGIARGREVVHAIGYERAVEDLAACEESLRGDQRVGVVGFGWGGTLAYLANTRLGLPAVSYYGGRTPDFLNERLRAPMEFHFGQDDPLLPPEAVEAHREAHPSATICVYAGGHAFNREGSSGYDAESAAEAQARTLNFFARVLR